MIITTEPRIKYVGDGSSVSYSFPFDYLRKGFVCVKFGDEEYSDFTVEDKTITLSDAPEAGTVIEIYRSTASSRLTSWGDGSVLTSKDMTIQQLQMLHILEELYVMFLDIKEKCEAMMIQVANMLVRVDLALEQIAQAVLKVNTLEPIVRTLVTKVENYLKKAVLTVNGKEPDTNGNVEVDVDTSHLATKEELNDYAKKTDIENFITKDVNNLTNYYSKAEIDAKLVDGDSLRY